MKTKYFIGLFSVLLILVILLTAGYQISYHFAVERQAARYEETERTTESISADGEALKEDVPFEEEGYYICELHGFVTVYLPDRTTIYELTEIPVSELPEEVAAEVAAGKHVATEGELYAFLENYSS